MNFFFSYSLWECWEKGLVMVQDTFTVENMQKKRSLLRYDC